MDKLKAMTTFVRIVDAGSLSAAAEAAGQSHASVVRTLAGLETYLGTRLLNRNTRRLALTEEGAEFLAWSRRILSEFEEVEHNFDARGQNASGLLRLTAPVEFGRRYVAPLVNAFAKVHRAVRFDLKMVDRVVDLLEEGLDFAVRIGRLPASTLISRAVGRTRLVVCASPEYLREAGHVEQPSDLAMRECISFAPQGRVWHFRQGGLDVTQAVSARLITDQVQVARTACVDGLGIARLLHYQVADELASGRLVRLLRVFEPEDQPVQVVYPHAKLLAPRVREFIDWACPELQRSMPRPN